MRAALAEHEQRSPTLGALAVLLGVAAVALCAAAMVLPGVVGPQTTGRLDDPELVRGTALQRWIAFGSWLGFPVSLGLALGAAALWKKSSRCAPAGDNVAKEHD